MKKLGMIGGLGPESTIEYYRNIIEIYRERQRDGSYPRLIINSVDLKEGLDFLYAGKLEAVAKFLLREIEKLARAGAEFGIITANTPHIVFGQIMAKSPVPLISIVEASCAFAKAREMKRLALFGTKFTMQADFYQKVFARESIKLVVPESQDQDYIHEKYMAELIPGNFLQKTRAALLAIVDRMKAKSAIDGVLLAGTEIPMILRGESHNGVALLDTGKIHCQAAVNEMFLTLSRLHVPTRYETVKHIGIVSCSAEGAALCYRTICSTSQKYLGGHRHPEISMHTPCFEEYVQNLNSGNWSGVARLMVASANKLAIAGADFLICPDNTIHRALPEVLLQTDLPWLHIADVVADEALRRAFKCSGIMGTRWLVDGDVYPAKFQARNLKYLRPGADERDEINRIIMDELVRGEFKSESVDYLCRVTQRMKAAGCDSVVLGCTELPLVVSESNSALPVLDSTRLLAWAAVREATGIHSAHAH